MGLLRPGGFPRISELKDTLDLAPGVLAVCNVDLRLFERLVGILVWICLGQRPLLSLLLHTFKLLEDARTLGCRYISIGTTIRRELENLTALSAYSRVSLRRPTWKAVACVDTSEVAGAVVYASVRYEDVRSLVSAFQRYTRHSSIIRTHSTAPLPYLETETMLIEPGAM